MLISLLASCSGSNEEANGNESTSTSVPQSDENDSPTPVDGIYSWVSRAYTKNMKNGKAPETLVTSAEVHMARNETEGVQFSFTSDRRKNGYKLKTEDSYTGISVEMFRLYFVQANGKNYPDPIAPSEGVVSFSAGETRSILVNFITTAETEAGEYKYTFELHDKEDKLVTSYDVTVKVYDIVYPETPTLDTAFGIELRSLIDRHAVASRRVGDYRGKRRGLVLMYEGVADAVCLKDVCYLLAVFLTDCGEEGNLGARSCGGDRLIKALAAEFEVDRRCLYRLAADVEFLHGEEDRVSDDPDDCDLTHRCFTLPR
jgi:hypothetical protein